MIRKQYDENKIRAGILSFTRVCSIMIISGKIHNLLPDPVNSPSLTKYGHELPID